MGLTTFLNDLIEICTFLIEMFISIMSIFMEAPLNIYIGIVLFLIFIVIIEGFMKNVRGKKSSNFNYEKYNKELDKRIKADWEKTKFEKDKKY